VRPHAANLSLGSSLALHSIEKRHEGAVMSKLDVPQGTLDLMILTILAREPMHGYGISQRLAALSHDNFQVNPGSLFPSLYRLEQDGKLKAEWRASENNRKAKYYRLTASGKRQLEQHRQRWDRTQFAITSVLEGA
jgi:PadR family transcriptional regulator